MEFSHIPVMGPEVIRYLDPRPGGVYVDATVGGGGHALEILRACKGCRLIGMDRDGEALKAAAENLRDFMERVTLVRENFRDMKEALRGLGVERADGMVFDLGVSSYQFDEAGRGFSFRFDSRLDMRMDTRQATTARDLVNTLDADELAGIFREYGEERDAKRIARAIERARRATPVETTGELVRIILDTVPKRFHAGAIHPATKVFQALRIAVNDELNSLSEGLAAGVRALRAGGRLVVISFHSLEDRIVKKTLRELSVGCVCPARIPRCVCGRTPEIELLTKRSVTPSEEEVRRNPRARSARLRAAVRI